MSRVVQTSAFAGMTKKVAEDEVRLAPSHPRSHNRHMREIVFDTETTGLSHAGGDRMVEIGCVEIVGGMETGRSFHAYFNPDRDMPAEAEAVHGLTSRFLAAQPRFADTVEALLAFLEDAPLVAHNAPFDMGFLNAELILTGRPVVVWERMRDTLALAKQRHPGAKLTLDALCTRYGIDRSHRVKHGALLDAQLLARVYLELNGGRQIGLTLAADDAHDGSDGGPDGARRLPRRPVRPARPHRATDAELAAHAAFLTRMADPLWARLDP